MVQYLLKEDAGGGAEKAVEQEIKQVITWAWTSSELVSKWLCRQDGCHEGEEVWTDECPTSCHRFIFTATESESETTLMVHKHVHTL